MVPPVRKDGLVLHIRSKDFLNENTLSTGFVTEFGSTQAVIPEVDAERVGYS